MDLSLGWDNEWDIGDYYEAFDSFIISNRERSGQDEHNTNDYYRIHAGNPTIRYIAGLRAEVKKELRCFMSSLPTVPISHVDEQECPICLELLSETTTKKWSRIVQLPCYHEHYIHSDCIQLWTSQNPTCPLDRTVLFQSPATVRLEEFLTSLRF